MLNSISAEQPPLPSAYQEVEYIQSTGSQYLITDITPKPTQEYYIKASFQSEINQVGFGSRTSGTYSSSTNQVYFNMSGGDYTIYLGSKSNRLTRPTETGGVVEYDINHTDYLSNCDGTGTRPFYIFALNNLGSAYPGSQMKIYKLTIKENGLYVLDLIPCYRKSDNVVGMYDTVSGTFLTNQGRGTFLKGSDV